MQFTARARTGSSAALADSVEPKPVIPSATARAIAVNVFLTDSSLSRSSTAERVADPSRGASAPLMTGPARAL